MPAAPAVSPSNDGLFVFTGMYGSAWRDGLQLMDVIEASGTVTIGRVDMNLVGQEQTAHKPGRQSRDGTMTVQKVDSKWEMEVFNFLSQSLAQRRRARDAGNPLMRPFSLILENDDPYALGRERWQLDGVLVWALPLGFSIGNDAVQTQYPITWQSERPLETFRKDVGPGGVAVPNYYVGPTP